MWGKLSWVHEDGDHRLIVFFKRPFDCYKAGGVRSTSASKAGYMAYLTQGKVTIVKCSHGGYKADRLFVIKRCLPPLSK